ncbi:hypothetical protein O0L34_g6377 [Tuta absoluta]|nr:hypothetical protein O0L34_g6377 [Tuta absoluta]
MGCLLCFQYGRQHIEVAKKISRNDSSDEEEDPPVPDDKPPSAIIKENGSLNGTKMTVIERDEILGPSPELNYKRSGSQERPLNPQNHANVSKYRLFRPYSG